MEVFNITVITMKYLLEFFSPYQIEASGYHEQFFIPESQWVYELPSIVWNSHSQIDTIIYGKNIHVCMCLYPSISRNLA